MRSLPTVRHSTRSRSSQPFQPDDCTSARFEMALNLFRKEIHFIELYSFQECEISNRSIPNVTGHLAAIVERGKASDMTCGSTEYSSTGHQSLASLILPYLNAIDSSRLSVQRDLRIYSKRSGLGPQV